MSTDSYGQYILTTGRDIGQYELERGLYYYQTYFKGMAPILNLAPGRCWFTKQNPVDIVGVDNSPDIVNHYSAEGLNLVLGDAYEIPFPDNYFEGIHCSWLFEHLTQPEKVLQELYRVAKPDGYICIVVPTPHNMNAFYDDYTHIRPFTQRSLVQLAKVVGFEKYQTTYLHFDRLSRYIHRFFGSVGVQQYFFLSDIYLRKLEIVNRKNLMLEAWKPKQ